MQKKKYISRLIGLMLFIIITAAGYTFDKKASGHAKKQPKHPSSLVSELHHEVVVPNHSFEFNQFYYFPHGSVIFIVFIKNNFIPFVAFTNTYFSKLFEHHIAINAP